MVLTRHAEQIAAIEALGLPNCVVPRAAIDSRSLVYAADLMIGAGGTMTREAAVMGIPTWTLFAGKTPAVDEWLERHGMLSRLTARRATGRTSRRGDPARARRTSFTSAATASSTSWSARRSPPPTEEFLARSLSVTPAPPRRNG